MTQLLANVGKGFSALKATLPGTQVVFERTVIAAVIVAALYLGRELFVPLAVSVLLAFSLSPVVRFMTRKLRLPRSLAVTATGLMTFAGLFAIGAVITNQVSSGGQLPSFQSALKKLEPSSFASSDGGAIDQASNTLKDLERELSKGSPARLLLPQRARMRPHVCQWRFIRRHQPRWSRLKTSSPWRWRHWRRRVILVFVIFLLLQQHDVRDRAIRLVGSHDLERTTVAIDDAGSSSAPISSR